MTAAPSRAASESSPDRGFGSITALTAEVFGKSVYAYLLNSRRPT
jgi:hypothetical protein